MSNTRSGQTTVEYTLVIAVLVVAMVAGLYLFVGDFNSAMDDLSNSASTVYTSGNLAN